MENHVRFYLFIEWSINVLSVLLSVSVDLSEYVSICILTVLEKCLVKPL